MSATTVLYTNICFMILYAKKNLISKKGIQHVDLSLFIILRVFLQWLFSLSRFLQYVPNIYQMTLFNRHRTCLSLPFSYLCLNTYKMSFPYYSKNFSYQQKDFSRVTDRIPKFHLLLTCLIEVNYY